MTISEMIQTVEGYADYRKRDAWVYQGSQLVDNSSTSYYGGVFYVVNETESALYGAMIFFTSPIFSAINWLEYQYVNGEIQRTDTLHIPTEMLLALTVDEYNAIEEAIDNSFIPFQETVTETSPTVVIPESEIRLILREAGIPFITWEELEYSLDDIKSLIIRPALEMYYKYFPIKIPIEYPCGANGKFSVDMPTDPNFTTIIGCFGANSSQDDAVSGIGNSFQMYRDTMLGGLFMGGSSLGGATARGRRRSPGLKFNHNELVTNSLNTSAYSSILNRYARVKYTRTHDHKVEGYHTGARFVTIEWGYLSENWDDIWYERKPEVRNLATAYALRTFGQLRDMVPSESPGRLDYSKWISRAEILEKEVIEMWHDFTKAVVVKSR